MLWTFISTMYTLWVFIGIMYTESASTPLPHNTHQAHRRMLSFPMPEEAPLPLEYGEHW
jgi:hypothetical protein